MRPPGSSYPCATAGKRWECGVRAQRPPTAWRRATTPPTRIADRGGRGRGLRAQPVVAIPTIGLLSGWPPIEP